MNSRPCCRDKMRAGADIRRPALLLRYGGEAAGWIFPSIALALLPKCPACVVAYVALATGAGISLSSATHLRTTLLILCLVLIASFAARQLRRLISRADVPQ